MVYFFEIKVQCQHWDMYLLLIYTVTGNCQIHHILAAFLTVYKYGSHLAQQLTP